MCAGLLLQEFGDSCLQLSHQKLLREGFPSAETWDTFFNHLQQIYHLRHNEQETDHTRADTGRDQRDAALGWRYQRLIDISIAVISSNEAERPSNVRLQPGEVLTRLVPSIAPPEHLRQRNELLWTKCSSYGERVLANVQVLEKRRLVFSLLIPPHLISSLHI